MNAAEKEKAGPPIPTFQRSSLIAATSSQNNRLICKPVTCLLQYMILKTFCAVLGILAFVLGLCGVYGDGDFKWHYGFPVLNSSQMETYVEAPGTSVTSVQDIVIGGGGHVNSLPLSVSPSPQL